MQEVLFYYNLLNEKERKVYYKVKYAIENFENNIELGFAICNDKIARIVQYVLYDNPILFYLDQRKIQIISSVSSKEIVLDYYYTQKKASILRQQIQNKCKWIESTYCKGKKDNYDKLKSLYKYFISNYLYSEKVDEEAYSIVGVIINEEAVCQGFAYAFKYLLDQMRIKSTIVVGNLNRESHAWNMVWLDNDIYHLDVTVGITISKCVGIRYNYFLANDTFMKNTHQWNQVLYPKCNGINYNYYYKECMVARNIKEIQQILIKKCSENTRNIDIKLEGELAYLFTREHETVMQEIIDNLVKMSILKKNKIEYSYMNEILSIQT